MARQRQHGFLLAALVLVAGLTAVTWPPPAHAEQCSAFSPDRLSQPVLEGQICLLSETSQPLLPGGTLEFRVPAATTRFYAISCPVAGYWSLLGHCENAALPTAPLTAGPPGGTSVWQATLAPWFTTADGPLVIETETSSLSCDSMGGACTGGSGVANFTASGLTIVVNEQMTLAVGKRRVTGVFRYQGRATLKAVAQLWINSFQGGPTHILGHRGTSAITGSGGQVIRVTLSRRRIERKCREYRHCSVLATGQLWSSRPGSLESYAVSYANERRRVK